MGKVQSISSKVVGKVGSNVFYISKGQNIVREYNPSVANPNTVSQMNTRAGFKLMSQLAAALAPVIAIPSQGSQSSRNRFMSVNKEQVISNNGAAQIVYENIQLTEGNAGFPALSATRDTNNVLQLTLTEDVSAAVNRVVYIVYKKNADNTLQYAASRVVSDAGTTKLFPLEIAGMAGELVIFAYGMKDTGAGATAKYGNYSVQNGEDLARLIMNRTLSAGQYQYTKTRGITLFSGTSETVNPGANQFMVYVNTSGPGAVTKEGFSGNRKAVNEGESITITAVPNDGCTFLGWKYAGETSYFSTNAELTLVVNNTIDVTAVFNNPNSSSGSDSGTGEPDEG